MGLVIEAQNGVKSGGLTTLTLQCNATAIFSIVSYY